jgi:hypothetical protein
MSIRKVMANQTIDNLQVQLKQFFEDPEFELDGITKATIHKSFAKIEKEVKKEFEQEHFEKNTFPGFADLIGEKND